MINFLSLTIRNFLGIRGPVELELNRPGLHLITGKNLSGTMIANSNGAGKSTLLESLVWVLFGRTIRSINADDVVNRQEGKNTHVELVLSVKGVTYQVNRFRLHDDYHNTVQLLKDSADITCATVKQTQELINNILGMTYRTFVNSIVFGHGLTDFFTAQSDSNKKEILEDILELHVFDECQDLVRQKLKFYSKSIDKVDKNRVRLRASGDQLHKTIQDTARKIEEACARETIARKDLQCQLDNHRESLALQVKEESNLRAQLQEVSDKLKVINETIIPAYNQIQEEINKIKSQKELLAYRKDIINKKMVSLQNEFNSLEATYLNQPCPFCGMLITEGRLSHVLAAVSSQLVESKAVMSALLEEENQLPPLPTLDEYIESLDECTQLGKKQSILRQQLFDISVRIATIKTDIEMVNRLISQPSQLDSLVDLQESYVDEYYQATQEANKFERALANLNEQKKLIEFWDIGFSSRGIRSWIINAYLPYINTLISHFAAQIGLSDVKIELVPGTTTRSGNEIDRIELVLNGGLSYNSFSSGERRRIDLAILLALQVLVYNHTPEPMSILFFDEIFDTLDESGSELIIQTLALLQQKFYNTIFVISHNEWLKPYFVNQIEVIRDEEETTINWEEQENG